MQNITSFTLNLDICKIIHSTFFTVSISILVFLAFLKFIHILIKNSTNKIIKSTEDGERIKEITTISHLIRSVIDTVLILVFIMIILTKLKVDIRPILTAAGVLGVAVGFGAKRFVEDIITGLIILLEGQIRVGDVIQIGDKTGVVEKIDIKMVVLRDMQGKVHYIRNGMIDIVTNMTRDFSYYVLDLNISYKEDIDKVINELKTIFKEELLSNAEMAKNILEDLEVLGVDELTDTAAKIKLRIKTKPMSQWVVGREFNRLIKNRFDKKNINYHK